MLSPMTRTRTRDLRIILILGALSTVSPFSIDMYLPAFPQIAQDLGTTPAEISLSVAGYFIGLAVGQLFYGPLLDRFGRKLPICAGLVLFILASLACLTARSPKFFIAARLLQALGGCAAQVGSTAMVRDYFPVEESAKIISLLILVLSVSPLFAPTVGGFVATSAGWQWIFLILAAFALLAIALTALLPEGHKPDPSISLRPSAMLRGFAEVIGEPRFYTYAFAGAFSFAGLFVYVTGSPIIFLDGFHVDPRTYGLIFAGLAASCIGAAQLNIWLTRRYSGDAIFRAAVIGQTLVMAVTFIGTALDWFGLAANIILLLLYLGFCGPSFPNAAAMALAPFSKNVGSASALLGFIQMGIGALASTGVGLLHASTSLPIYAVMAATAVIGLVILLANQKRIGMRPVPRMSDI
jgi:DHA1 family bicyclomycin/chloramphenicol resistance-like MFS transporter